MMGLSKRKLTSLFMSQLRQFIYHNVATSRCMNQLNLQIEGKEVEGSQLSLHYKSEWHLRHHFKGGQSP